MKHSERSAIGVIVLLLMVMAVYTYILLIVSSNRPLFAQLRVVVHGRISPRGLSVIQKEEIGSNNNNRTRGAPKYSLPANIEQGITGLNIIIPILNSNNNNNNS